MIERNYGEIVMRNRLFAIVLACTMAVLQSSSLIATELSSTIVHYNRKETA